MTLPHDATEGLASRLTIVLRAMVEALVSNPGAVVVQGHCMHHRIVLELETDPVDVGLVVGRHGAVVTAIRTILSAVGGRSRVEVNLDYTTDRVSRG